MPNMLKLRFYKDPDTRWYVDLPEWPGDKSDLEMVAGADTLLQFLAVDKSEVTLIVSEERFEPFAQELIRIEKEIEGIIGGAFYKVNCSLYDVPTMDIWLCDVLKFVFGKFPDKIYFKCE